MKIAYQAVDKSGKLVRGQAEANDKAEAMETLRRQGLFVTEIHEASAVSAASGKGRARIGRGKRLKCLAMFSRQLHVLVGTGIPLTQSLEALERQVKPGPWKAVLVDVCRRVEEGSPLSEAMGRHPGYFDTICRSMVESGETGGNLTAMLDRM